MKHCSAMRKPIIPWTGSNRSHLSGIYRYQVAPDPYSALAEAIVFKTKLSPARTGKPLLHSMDWWNAMPACRPSLRNSSRFGVQDSRNRKVNRHLVGGQYRTRFPRIRIAVQDQHDGRRTRIRTSANVDHNPQSRLRQACRAEGCRLFRCHSAGEPYLRTGAFLSRRRRQERRSP